MCSLTHSSEDAVRICCLLNVHKSPECDWWGALHRSAPCHANNSCNDIEEGRSRTWLVHLTWLLKSRELGCWVCPFQSPYTGNLQYEEKGFYFIILALGCLAFPPKQRVVELQERKLVKIKYLWRTQQGADPLQRESDLLLVISWCLSLYLGITLGKKTQLAQMLVGWLLLPTSVIKMFPSGVYRGEFRTWAGKSSSFIHM